MSVGEEVPEPGVRQVLLDAAAYGPVPPLAAGAIGALRQPAAHRSDSEQTPVLAPAARELQPDALVAAEERQVAVRRRRSHDLEAPLLLEAAERRDQVPVDRPEQRLQAIKAHPPELHERQQRCVPAPPPRRRSPLPPGPA